MHPGINTGLTVSGDVDLERGKHGIAGDCNTIGMSKGKLDHAGVVGLAEQRVGYNKMKMDITAINAGI